MKSSQPASEDPSSGRWSLVLAGGEGSRLQALTTSQCGESVPKQFCSLRGEASLLRQALGRAAAVTSIERTLVVVAQQHRRWWEVDLRDLPAANVIVQPSNRGTAAGILYPLSVLLDRDPNARLLVVPSDHFVADEVTLGRAAAAALERIERRDRIVLLGISPGAPEPGFGWIVPGRRTDKEVFKVSQFVEKPQNEEACRLMARGALWNSFLFAARASNLWHCFRRCLPELVKALEVALAQPDRFAACYEELPELDFSREVLQRSNRLLEVTTVSPCGWNDLGTPQRVAQTLSWKLARKPPGLEAAIPAQIDLSMAHRRLMARSVSPRSVS